MWNKSINYPIKHRSFAFDTLLIVASLSRAILYPLSIYITTSALRLVELGPC
jgi:hypothetical protein